MTDKEKVMRGLEVCTTSLVSCYGCPYRDETGCPGMTEVMRDALALLKEQERQLQEWEKYAPFLAAHGCLLKEEGDE